MAKTLSTCAMRFLSPGSIWHIILFSFMCVINLDVNCSYMVFKLMLFNFFNLQRISIGYLFASVSEIFLVDRMVVDTPLAFVKKYYAQWLVLFLGIYIVLFIILFIMTRYCTVRQAIFDRVLKFVHCSWYQISE